MTDANLTRRRYLRAAAAGLAAASGAALAGCSDPGDDGDGEGDGGVY